MRVIVVAGTHSGVGKTSVTVGLLAALNNRGLKVQPFKVGPDFLDPMHHLAACGTNSVNLDGWMMGREHTLASLARFGTEADVAIVEGVMGLYDGRDGKTEAGSTAEIAKWIGAPVMLVLDCWSLSRSIGAVVKGYKEFDVSLNLAAVVFNKVGGAAHVTWLSEALSSCSSTKDIAILGGLPKSAGVEVRDRHLGLDMPSGKEGTAHIAALAALVEAHMDLDRLLEIATLVTPGAAHVGSALTAHAGLAPAAQVGLAPVDGSALEPGAFAATATNGPQLARDAAASDLNACTTLTPGAGNAKPSHQAPTTRAATLEQVRAAGEGTDGTRYLVPRIAVARDEAFCFYYAENLTMLEAAGAELISFSPLHDSCLPPNIAGMYLGGGYPEHHAEALSRNKPMLHAIRSFCEQGGVVYAECGGLMYLSEGIQLTADQQLLGTVGVLPFSTRMNKSKMCMGYVEVTTQPGCNLFPAGATVRGQVYHFSEIVHPDGSPAPLDVKQRHEARSGDVAAAGVGHGGMGSGRTVTAAAPAGSSGVGVGDVTAAVEPTVNGVVGCIDSRAVPVGKDRIAGDNTGLAGELEGLESSSSTEARQSEDGRQGTGGGAASRTGVRHVRHGYSMTMQVPGAPAGLPEGFMVNNVLASYVHLHFASCPGFPASLVAKCRDASTILNQGASIGMGGANRDLSRSGKAAVATVPSPQLGVGSPAAAGVPSMAERATELQATALCDAAAAVNGTGKHLEPLAAPPPPGSRTPVVSGVCQDARDVTTADCNAFMGNTLLAGSSDASLVAPTAGGTAHAQCAASIVSMTPAATEILFALGLGDRLTGVTDLCDYPPAAKLGRTIVCVSKMDTSGMSSAEVEKRMQTIRMDAEDDGSPFLIANEWLARNLPDLVITQGTCDRCDASYTAVHRALLRAASSSGTTGRMPAVLVQDCRTFEQVLDLINEVGAAAGDAAASRALVEALRVRLQRVQALVAPASQRPRLVSLEGLEPLVMAGHWFPDMKRLAGGSDPYHTPGCAAERVTWELVVSLAPEVLVLCPCSRSVTSTLQEVAALAALPGWSELPAVLSGQVYIVDHAVFSRPGPRLVDGVEILARILHPGLVQQAIPAGVVRKLCPSKLQQCSMPDQLAQCFLPYT